MYDVITVGSATRDVFLVSPHFRVVASRQYVTGRAITVPYGSKVHVDRVMFETGGGATNTAVTFARLGFKTAFIGKIGQRDARGAEILEKLREEGIDTTLVSRDRRWPTGYSVMLMTPAGERTALVYRGASSHLTPGDVPSARMRARWLYITSLAGNLPLLKRLLRIARQRKIKVAFNPGESELNWGLKKLIPILRQLSAVFLNREEASLLTGLPYAKDRAMFESLCFHLPGIVVITEGKKGASVCDNARKYISVPKNVKVRNTTGAGDAFCSGFIAALLRRPNDLSFALQLATANAESVIQSFGAKAGILRRIPPRSSLCTVRVLEFPNG